VDYYYIRSYDHNRDTVYGQPDEQMYFTNLLGSIKVIAFDFNIKVSKVILS